MDIQIQKITAMVDMVERYGFETTYKMIAGLSLNEAHELGYHHREIEIELIVYVVTADNVSNFVKRIKYSYDGEFHKKGR